MRLSASLRVSIRETALAYATVLLSGRAWVGAALLVITLWLPWQGLTGLAAVLIALAGAKVLGFEKPGGSLLFNPLLCGLALGHWVPQGALSLPAYGGLLVVVSLSALVATVVINNTSLVLGGVPSMSIPFCVVATALHWFLQQTNLAPLFSPSLFDLVDLPAPLALWGHSMGAIFFAPEAAIGLAMTLALVAASRFHLLHGVLGFAASVFFLKSFAFPAGDAAWLHLNCILTAVAVGGVFFLPSGKTLLLATAAAAACAFVGLALSHLLQLADAPVLTLPFNVTTLALVAALRWRSHARGVVTVTHASASPEETLRASRLLTARLPEPELPAINPPFDGEWVVTQGFDGEITHRGAWQHALDFELATSGQEPFRPESTNPEDFPSFGAPIIAPADGLILRVVNDVKDNPIGGNNLDENWGNSVLLEIAPGLYVQLSHFRSGGVRVREGERVRKGQLLGYLGNSGRSPFPHLHLQMQVQPEIGAATIPFRLRDYRIPREKWTFQFRGLPAKGQVVAGVRPIAWLGREAVCPLEGSIQHYRVFTAGAEHEETITQTLAAGGGVTWTSSHGGAVLQTQTLDHVLIPLSYSGSRHSLLSLFWLAGRIPLAGIQGLQWTETTDGHLLRGRLEQGARDLIEAYLPRPMPQVHGEVQAFDAKRRKVTISCAFSNGNSHRTTRRLELNFQDGLKLASAHLETPVTWMHVVARSQPSESLPKTPFLHPSPGALMVE